MARIISRNPNSLTFDSIYDDPERDSSSKRDQESYEATEIDDVLCIRDSVPGNLGMGALLCKVLIKGRHKLTWIPKSLIDEDSEVYNATDAKHGKLIIPKWLAIDRELV